MPLYSTLLPIAIPTVYLWILDSVALQRGTWVINDRRYAPRYSFAELTRAVTTDTKYGLSYLGLEIEYVHRNFVLDRISLFDFRREAVFFFLTNVLIVFGLVAWYVPHFLVGRTSLIEPSAINHWRFTTCTPTFTPSSPPPSPLPSPSSDL